MGFAVAYLAFALLSREAPGAGFDSVVRPAGGIAILWLLLRQPGLAGLDTALLTTVAYVANSVTGADPGVAALITATNVGQSVLAVVLLRRWCPSLWGCGGTRPLDRPRVLAPYCAALVVALGLGALVAAVGVAAIEGGEQTAEGILWFGRNLCSALVMVTAGLLLGQRLTSPRPRRRLLGEAGPVELVAATAFTVVMYGLAFVLVDEPLAFVLLAATVWFALRFSTLLSSLHSLLVGFATLGLTVNGIGPFAAVERTDLGYLVAQFFVAAISVTGMILATGRDERQALSAELRRSQEEALYEASVRDAVIGSITEGLIVVDQTGELLIQNGAASALLGDGTGPLTSDSRFALSSWSIDGAELDDSQRPTARALRGETVHGAEVVLRIDGQPERVLSISGIPLPRDEIRNRSRALMIFRDVTEEHAHRQELASFAGVVAHDLRNPLAAIDGWTEMIADELDGGDLDPQTAREFVARVRSSSGRMRELIRDLLAHATSGSRDLDLCPVDIGALVAEIAAARHAEDRVVCEPVPPVLADPVLIRQAVDNLIGNALKYVAPGVEPEISVRGRRSGSRLVTVQVVDNGIGIPVAERERVFEEFHRAHYRDYEGSGLGLSIVRRIITRHDGTIVARANPTGRGSLFEFTLPAYDAAAAQLGA
ncbi:ATP-binding protein [Nocardioides caricicola]|uniref:Sensor-like histidine kinase SenX3 n=1 Tax=Nocardioides caricicola TaxID=634770 RepID=A0ABW0N9S2_9ACTN